LEEGEYPTDSRGALAAWEASAEVLKDECVGVEIAGVVSVPSFRHEASRQDSRLWSVSARAGCEHPQEPHQAPVRTKSRPCLLRARTMSASMKGYQAREPWLIFFAGSIV